MRLSGYDPSVAGLIAGWPRDASELEAWASLVPHTAGLGVFEGWHADPDVHPYVLWDGDRVCAYGEVWVDEAEAEAELARIIVDPARRGRGVGRTLVGLLVERAQAVGYADIWVRVLPGNGPAIACYSAAGFRRTTPDRERAFNAGQPHEYMWMRHQPMGAQPKSSTEWRISGPDG